MDAKTKQIKTNLNLMYAWLMAASVVTVPAMLIGTQIFLYRDSTMAYIAVVLLPGAVHGILLFGLASKTLYVKRHTQQALWLVGIRMFLAVVAFGLTAGDEYLYCLWGFVSGFVWLFGSVWGWRQVSQGDCWLMRRNGEYDKLLKNIKPNAPLEKPTPTTTTKSVDSASNIPIPSIPTVKAMPTTNSQHIPNPYTAYLQGKALAQQGKNQEAIAALLLAFRHGSEVMQGYVLKEMEQLGEVDKI